MGAATAPDPPSAATLWIMTSDSLAWFKDADEDSFLGVCLADMHLVGTCSPICETEVSGYTLSSSLSTERPLKGLTAGWAFQGHGSQTCGSDLGKSLCAAAPRSKSLAAPWPCLLLLRLTH